MAKRIVVDPITRIEGHLRIEADYDGSKITDAYSAGTMFRGIEIMMKGRDPRNAWTLAERICGVCTHIHALASLRAVEDALDYKIPKNAQYIRNIMHGTQFIHDHVVHFYNLHGFDWIDVASALKADPKATAQLAQSISNWPGNSEGHFRDVQKKVKALVESDLLRIVTVGYWGSPAYKLPPEANLMAVTHYLQALDWQKNIVRIHTIFGGKNPHPHYTVGGMASAINMNNLNTINQERLNEVATQIAGARDFVTQVYIPDLFAIASFYKKWLYGSGGGNYLVYGEEGIFPGGAILNNDLSRVYDVDVRDPKQIQEFVNHSWYDYSGNQEGRHPWYGETNPNYTGPKPTYRYLDVNKKYSWVKSPRWKGHPMEVGPLARMLVGYAKGNKKIKSNVDDVLKKLGVGKEALFSALGRTLCRGLETGLMLDYLSTNYNNLVANIKAGDSQTFNSNKWDPSTWPSRAKGVGTCEAPRGALGHWIEIGNGKLSKYQTVVPSTWNASPRDNKGQMGPYEVSLRGVPMADSNEPVELLRIIHSFDPCLACATHITDLKSGAKTIVSFN